VCSAEVSNCKPHVEATSQGLVQVVHSEF